MPNIPIAPAVPTEEIEQTRFDGWKPVDGFKPVQFKQQTAKEILSHTDKDESSARSTVAAYLNNRYKENIDDVLLNYDVMSKQFGLSGNPMADAESIRAGEHDIDNRMTSMSLNLEATEQYKQDTSSTWSDIKNSLDVGFLSDFIGAGVQGAAKGFEMMKDPYAGITDAPEGTPEAVTFTSDEDTGRINFVDKSKIPVGEPLVSSEGVRQWRKEVEERNAISPEFAESFGGQVARAFGQAGALPIYMVAAPIATGMSVAQAYQFGEDKYREYTEQNDVPYDEAEARKAGLWNMPSAALDVIGDKFVVGKILGKARKSGKPMTGSKLREFGRDLIQSGTLGGATEGSQEMWENFNAKYLSGYDPEAEITEGALTAFAIGTIIDTTSTGVGKGGKSAVEKALDKWFHPIKGMSPQDMGAAFSTVSDPEFEAWNKKAFGNRKDENGVPLQDLARAARQKDMAAAAALSKSQTEQIAEDDADGVTEAERKAADELDERELEPEEYADPFEETSPENEAIQSKRDAIETAKVFIQENPDLPVVQSGNMDKIIARFEAEIAEIEAQVAAEAQVKADVDPNARPEDVQAAQAADEASREKAGQVSDMVDYLNQTLMEGSELENAPSEIRSLQSDLDSMLRAGVPEAAVKKFAESALKAANISVGTDPSRITIDGVQRSKVKRDGKYTSKSKIYGTADPFTAIEEIAHDYTDRKVAEGVYTYAEHYRPWVDLIDGKGTSENMSDRDIKERLADYVKGYSLTKAKDSHAAMPTSFRTWLNGALSSIKSVLQSASVLRSLRNVGAINKDLEAFLDRSLGLDDAELMRYEQGRQSAAQQVSDESYSLSEIDAEAEAQTEAEKARKEGEYKTPTEQKYEAAKADFDANPESQSDKKFEALILLKEKARKSREAYDLRKSYTDKKKAPAMRKVDKILTERKTFEDVRVTLRKLDEIVRGLHPNLRTRFRGFESPAGYNVNEADRIKFLERQRQRVQDVFDREKYYNERRAARKRWQSWNKNIDEARAGRKKLNVSNGEAVSAFIKDHLPITTEQREVIEDRIDAINDDIFQTLNSTTAGDEKAVIAARAKVAESQTELEGLQQRLGRAKFWSNKVGASQIEMFERDLQSLIKTGRTEFDIRKEKQQEQIKSEASAIKDEIQASMKSGKKLDQALANALGKRASEDFNTIKTKSRKMAKVEEFITAHLRPETQMDLMTGEADNALIEFIFNRLADAEYAYQAAMQANSDIIKDEVVGDASFDPDAVLLAGTSLTVDRTMAIYAYSQSAAGRAHLNSTTFEGMLLTDDVVDQILTSLPAEVKAVVDRSMVFLDTTIYPKINQTFLGQFGVELPRSDNYFPIQGLNRDTSIEDILNDYGHARAVGRGMTKGRVKSELPFENLKFTETFFNAVSRGERYANMSDAHAQARSTMEYKDVTRAENGDVESVNWEMQKAMKARSGVMTESLNGWLARVALGRAAPSDMGWLSVIGSIRRNISAGWLAYNPKTVITQTLSVSPAVGMATDKGEMVSYLTKYGSSIKEATEAAEFANRSSQMMATRGENISLALNELMETQAVKRAFALEGKLSSFRETGFVPMQKFDKYLSVGIWNAEYKTVSNRALSEGKSPDEAHAAGVAAGDKIVRTTQSTADVINSAEIMMSSNQLVRAFVMFRTDINQTMNNMISDFKLSKTDRERFDSALNSAAWMVFLPAVMLSAIAAVAEETAEFLGFKDDDDRKGDDLSNFAKSIASESVGQTVGSLLLAGDLIKGGADMIVGSENSRFANDLNSPVLSVVGNLNTGDRRALKSALLVSGVPLSKYIADADKIASRWWDSL